MHYSLLHAALKCVLPVNYTIHRGIVCVQSAVIACIYINHPSEKDHGKYGKKYDFMLEHVQKIQ